MSPRIDPDALEAAAKSFWESWPHPKVALVSGRSATWRGLPEVTRRQVRVCILIALKEYDFAQK